MELKLESLVIREENLDFTEIDEDIAMMDIKSGKYFILNSVAADIWKSIGCEMKIKEIIVKLKNTYNVDDKECEREVLDILNKMKNAKILKLVS